MSCETSSFVWVDDLVFVCNQYDVRYEIFGIDNMITNCYLQHILCDVYSDLNVIYSELANFLKLIEYWANFGQKILIIIIN